MTAAQAKTGRNLIGDSRFGARTCSIARENFRNLDAASLARGEGAGAHYRKRDTRVFATHFGRPVAAHGGGEFFELLHESVVFRAGDIHRPFVAALEHP